MMAVTRVLLLLLLPLVSATGRHVFLFPDWSNSAYVQLTPLKPLNLQAFTLCMRVATEINKYRETILFAYRTPQMDELNIWQEKGKISLYLGSKNGVVFTLLPLSAFSFHLCVTWDSSNGATMLWVDGRRSMLQIYKRGHRVKPNGAVILGQDPDLYLGGFDISQCFTGEITDLHMWDHMLNANQIKQLYEDQGDAPCGNVINWNSPQYTVYGTVVKVLSLDI